MNLTFKGFLKGYCQELTGLKTTNIKKLLEASLAESPRVAEPLFLMAVTMGKQEYLMRLAGGTKWKDDYDAVSFALSQQQGSLEATLQRGELPTRYQSVWDAYRAKKEAVNNDRRVNGLMREKTLAALREAGMSCYRLCKDLGLNKGNVYAYLHKGDDTKVSRNTARAIMSYAQSQVPEPVRIPVPRD